MSPAWAGLLSPDCHPRGADWWCRLPSWGELARGPGECGTFGHILKAFQWAEARFEPTLISVSCWVPLCSPVAVRGCPAQRRGLRAAQGPAAADTEEPHSG